MVVLSLEVKTNTNEPLEPGGRVDRRYDMWHRGLARSVEYTVLIGQNVDRQIVKVDAGHHGINGCVAVPRSN
jgi:hypothetical protein